MSLTLEYIYLLKNLNKNNPFDKKIEILSIKPYDALNTVKLNTSENAWKSIKLPNDEEANIIKNITSILNKISRDNFDTLSNDLYNLNINTEKCVKELVDIIFNKSIYEENFSIIYANLCYKLSKRNLKTEDNTVLNFHKEIVYKCKIVFENDDLTKKISLGNINFIGELYNKDLIPSDIIFNFLNTFFKNIGENNKIEHNVECLCKLLNTVGKKIDVITNKRILIVCFDNICIISNDKNIKPRYRFMIKDIIDLRDNNWINKRNQKIILNKK